VSVATLSAASGDPVIYTHLSNYIKGKFSLAKHKPEHLELFQTRQDRGQYSQWKAGQNGT